MGELSSLRITSLTWRPSRPPRALMSLAHSSYPRLNATPSAERCPSRDSDAPMVIGPVELSCDVVPVVPVALLAVQPARTPEASIATLAAAATFVSAHGREGLTPVLLPFLLASIGVLSMLRVRHSLMGTWLIKSRHRWISNDASPRGCRP